MRIGYLDGLRGLAAFSVVLCHLFLALEPGIGGYTMGGHPIPLIDAVIRYTPLYLPFAGDFAVHVFFVLSGFVLTYGYFERGGSLAGAAIRRYFRLAPVAIFSTLLAFGLIGLGLYGNQAGHITATYWLTTVCNMTPDTTINGALNALVLGGWQSFTVPDRVFRVNPYNPVLWTMYYELTGSLLIFGFASVFRGQNRRWIAYAAAIMLCLWQAPYYTGFFLGAGLADLGRGRTNKPLGLVAVMAGVLLGTWNLNPEWCLILRPLGAGLLLYGVLSLPDFQRLLSARPFQYLGRISFGMYATHLAVIFTVTCATIFLLKDSEHGVLVLAAVIVSLPLIIILGDLTSRLVDAPGIALSKKIYDRVFKEKPT